MTGSKKLYIERKGSYADGQRKWQREWSKFVLAERKRLSKK